METQAFRKSLTDQLEKYKNQIDEKRAELKALYVKGTVKKQGPELNKKNDDGSQPALSSISEEQSQRLAQEMIDTQLEIIKVESDLKTREDARQMSEEDQGQLSEYSDKQREQQILDEFRRDPDVVALTEEIAFGGRATRSCQGRWHDRAMTLLAGHPSRNTRS